jgi:hypothetical protein
VQRRAIQPGCAACNNYIVVRAQEAVVGAYGSPLPSCRYAFRAAQPLAGGHACCCKRVCSRLATTCSAVHVATREDAPAVSVAVSRCFCLLWTTLECSARLAMGLRARSSSASDRCWLLFLESPASPGTARVWAARGSRGRRAATATGSNARQLVVRAACEAHARK